MAVYNREVVVVLGMIGRVHDTVLVLVLLRYPVPIVPATGSTTSQYQDQYKLVVHALVSVTCQTVYSA
jgi:hypothetical protein